MLASCRTLAQTKCGYALIDKFAKGLMSEPLMVPSSRCVVLIAPVETCVALLEAETGATR